MRITMENNKLTLGFLTIFVLGISGAIACYWDVQGVNENACTSEAECEDYTTFEPLEEECFKKKELQCTSCNPVILNVVIRTYVDGTCERPPGINTVGVCQQGDIISQIEGTIISDATQDAPSCTGCGS
jgi:hypothetical protein